MTASEQTERDCGVGELKRLCLLHSLERSEPETFRLRVNEPISWSARFPFDN